MKRVHVRGGKQLAFYRREHELAETLPRCESLLKYRGLYSGEYEHPRKPLLKGYVLRVYSEYVPFEDLNKMLGRYVDRLVPEPFIWYVFFGLAEAIFAMNTYACARREESEGNTLDDINHQPERQSILHRGKSSGAILVRLS